ncbi:3-deoxy-D-manno-octulosonic acid kinase [Celerinatantimonas sp. YJH-8]|uniref:3-deoxy-D-manno-octulosonic acid kinase n=1 Tax=Celerinatantimonas sp. YJH-8 TaxID=3228714 RepID=UPI0038C821DA
MKIIKNTEPHSCIWFDGDLWSECPSQFFDPSYWRQQRAVVGQAQGRGQAVFFQHAESQYVLRHYRRGGMVGNISHDRYLYLGAAQSRCWQEFHLLSEIVKRGLPAPVPVAARLVRDGLFYRADLITQRIRHAQDLSELLVTQRLSVEIWQQVGFVIRQFHKAGVDHSDLNIHNIMLDREGKIWIIDLDKSRLRKKTGHWAKANLERLYRSLEKEQQRMAHWYWLKSDWQALLQGYLGEH